VHNVHARALSAAELTDAASSLVTTYTDKLNSVDTIGVLHQSGYMMLAATSGLFLYVTFLRPRFGVRSPPILLCQLDDADSFVVSCD